mmetsp:Transcript_1122/g.1308  ORF Transcript_1122/g.1308 Transcript_1122/m.1308 type:complete len:211 (-) Transcript_1122:45-677(-)|eukprot:CAMPEP_0197854500 /NCGR_PEP_ID=MMETSP1438-20131217/24797_1 /TAXON_ID=1461541 /ORGANISM="Pterosperma sp., Strain CCMP1384" /LENGTH=210 /DNA_ID=CAMNT_0043469263 /DNA_START=150 /DNA_END=782 /DNA_ORIENTATION=+
MDEGGINTYEKAGRHINKKVRRNKGAEAVFDPDAHKEWVGGFHKRKMQRRKEAATQMVHRKQKQHVEDRKRTRDDRQSKAPNPVYKVQTEDSDKDSNENENDDDDDDDAAEPEVMEYMTGTSVVIEEVVPKDSDSDDDNDRKGERATDGSKESKPESRGAMLARKQRQASVASKVKKLMATFGKSGKKFNGKKGKLKSSKGAKAAKSGKK